MINIEKTRHAKHNMLELKIFQLIQNAKYYAQDLDGFKRIFDEDIKKIKRPNINEAYLSYKCIPGQKILGDPPCLEIWHVNPQGMHDRLIAKITNE